MKSTFRSVVVLPALATMLLLSGLSERACAQQEDPKVTIRFKVFDASQPNKPPLKLPKKATAVILLRNPLNQKADIRLTEPIVEAEKGFYEVKVFRFFRVSSG